MSVTKEHTAPKPHLGGAVREAGDEQLSQRVRSLRLPQQKAAAPGKRWLLGTACVLLIAGGAAFGYVWINRSSAPSPSEAAPVNLNAATESASGEFALESKGYVIPAHQILVSPKVSGMIVKLRITESQRVVKDEILAELEDSTIAPTGSERRPVWHSRKPVWRGVCWTSRAPRNFFPRTPSANRTTT
jgi:hypothetical protein